MKSDQSNIKKAVKYLNRDMCIGIPTETVYGLAGNAYSGKAVKKIFKLKKRPSNNPLIIHYYNMNELKKDCNINDNFKKLYKRFSPGPITYVLSVKKYSKISKFATNKQKSLAVRFPKHSLFRKLLKNLDYPLAAPSANISTKLSSVQASDVKEEFGSVDEMIRAIDRLDQQQKQEQQAAQTIRKQQWQQKGRRRFRKR